MKKRHIAMPSFAVAFVLAVGVLFCIDALALPRYDPNDPIDFDFGVLEALTRLERVSICHEGDGEADRCRTVRLLAALDWRRDWTAADWLETPPAAGGVFRPFESPPLRQEAVFSRSKVFPCGRWRFSTVRKFPPATGDDFRAFESVPLQQEKTFKRSEQPKFCDLTQKQRIYA